MPTNIVPMALSVPNHLQEVTATADAEVQLKEILPKEVFWVFWLLVCFGFFRKYGPNPLTLRTDMKNCLCFTSLVIYKLLQRQAIRNNETLLKAQFGTTN